MSVKSLLELPLEVLLNIFENLQIGDLQNVMLTCKILRNLLINDNTLWRNLYRCKLRVQRSFNEYPSLSMYNHYRISYNWRFGIYRRKIVIQHNTNYMPWIQYVDGKYLLISVGSTLKCYSIALKTGTIKRNDLLWQIKVPTVQRHDIRTNDISRFILKNNIIVCGNRDGSVSVYEVNGIKWKPILQQHISDCHENGLVEVSSVETFGRDDLNYVVTASSRSPQLRFWDNNGYVQKAARDIVLPYNHGLRCLATNACKGRIAVGLNGNHRPIVLDIESGASVLNANTDIIQQKLAIRDIQWHDSNVVSYVTHSSLLRCIDVRSGEFVYKSMDPFHCSLYCMRTDGHRAIVTGAAEHSRCVLFDIRKASHHVQMYFTQGNCSPIYSLDFDSTRLIAAADRSVAVLNFDVNMATTHLKDYSQPFEVVS